jgi:2-polyprenyl-6-methoxyphenol hydroxylase-like FAD-dependent oxidoreductase
MTPIAEKTALVSGASIAGLTTAYWLTTLGYQVTIVEQAPTPRLGGAAINVQGEALLTAKRMGIYEQLKAQSLPPMRLSFIDMQEGTDTSQVGEDEVPDAHEASEELEIERAKLLAILLATLPTEVTFLFNNRITGLHETADTMQVTFREGPARTFDLVFGCDGLHSGVRQLWFGPEANYACFLQHYASLTIVDHLLVEENTAQLYSEPGKGILLNAYQGKTDIIFWFYAEQELVYDYRDTAQQRDIVLRQFAGQGWRTPELLAEVAAAGISYFDKFSQIKMSSWTKGRVALVGDAAYCASPAAGIGASLAMQGAAAMAQALATHEGHVEAAFQAYNHALRPFIEEVQATAVAMLTTFFVPKTTEEIQARNRGMLPL